MKKKGKKQKQNQGVRKTGREWEGIQVSHKKGGETREGGRKERERKWVEMNENMK
jgi:hypothetical protein